MPTVMPSACLRTRHPLPDTLAILYHSRLLVDNKSMGISKPSIKPIVARLRSRRVVLFLFILMGAFAFQNCSVEKFALQSSQDALNTPTCLPTDSSCNGGTQPTPPANVTLSENPNAMTWPENAIDGIRAAEVFQRQDTGTARITITLKQTVPDNLPHYSLSALSSSNTKESVLASGQRQSRTSFSFEISTGMVAKKIRLSFHDANGLEQARWTSPNFSVGEVFLVSGQSNSSTHGLGASRSRSSLNRGVDPIAKTWVPLADPLPYGSNYSLPPWNNPTFDSGSPWPAFADELSDRLQVPVAVIMVGWGGSAVDWWLPGYNVDYFSRMLVGARSVPNCGFRAVLWHQGESDAMGKRSASFYQSSLQNVISSFRSLSGCQQPWMIARATHNGAQWWAQNYQVTLAQAENMKWPSEIEIRKAQNAVARSGNHLEGPDTDLIVAARYRFDDLHFSATGLVLHGKLWAHRVLGLLRYPLQTEKDLVPEVKTVWDLMRTNLNRTDSEMAEDSEGLRYWVKAYSAGQISAATLAQSLQNSDEAFIRQVFIQDLGRRPSTTEMTLWLGKASSYANRDQLRSAIITSK